MGEHLVARATDAPLRSDEFDLHDYHQPSDEIKPDWDLSGAVEDAQILFDVGCQIANGAKPPEWKPGAEAEFKPGEEMNRQAGANTGLGSAELANYG